MNEPSSEKVGVERVGGVSRRFIASVAIVSGAILVALIKPWGGVAPAHDLAAPGFIFASPAPSAGGDPAIAAAVLRALCNQPADWRLISMETSALGDTRTMYGIEPLTASGPHDPTIPTAQVHADRLFGIGVCSPHAGENPNLPSPVTGVTIWFAPLVGLASRAAQAPVLDAALNDLGEAYFGPPPTETDPLVGNSSPVWPPGRYAVEIDRGDANGQTLWFGLEFAPPAGR